MGWVLRGGGGGIILLVCCYVYFVFIYFDDWELKDYYDVKFLCYNKNC